MRPYLSHQHPILFAHRGGAALWPENTMAAFAGAFDLGIRYMETDVHLTADGVVVAFHDHTLDRLTNGSGRVDQWRWPDLRRLDAAAGFQAENGYPLRGTGLGVLRFEDLVAAFPDALWNVDMKQSAVVEPFADLVMRLGLEDRVMGSSFYDSRLRRFRRVTGGRVATSAGPREVAKMAAAARIGRSAHIDADALQIPQRTGPFGLVNDRLLSVAAASGIAVHVWTVNDAPSMRSLFDAGVDGIMSDRPDVLVAVAHERPS